MINYIKPELSVNESIMEQLLLASGEDDGDILPCYWLSNGLHVEFAAYTDNQSYYASMCKKVCTYYKDGPEVGSIICIHPWKP